MGLWDTIRGWFTPRTNNSIVFQDCDINLTMDSLSSMMFPGLEVELEAISDEPKAANLSEMEDPVKHSARWMLRTQAEVDALEELAHEHPDKIKFDIASVSDKYQQWDVHAVDANWFGYAQYRRVDAFGKACKAGRMLGEVPPTLFQTGQDSTQSGG
jgi:hypothetical protein